MLEYEERMTFLDKMTKEHIVMTDYIFRQNDVFRQNDKRTYFMTDFETQNLEH